MDKQVP